MALEKVRDLLSSAQKANTSILAFEALDYNTIVACVKGAEQARRPVILMLQPTEQRIMTFRSFVEVVSALAKKSTVPIGLHLDHCSDVPTLLLAICEGFTSVMADGSALSFEENAGFVKSITEVAKIFDVDVEAQLGHVGHSNDGFDGSDKSLYTIPEEASLFAECTEINSLGIAIGNVHGAYKGKLQLDFDLLQKIHAATPIPLVLHGGSGLPANQLEQAMRMGISKLNVSTDYINLYEEAQYTYYKEQYKKGSYCDKYPFLREQLTNYIAEKLLACSLTV